MSRLSDSMTFVPGGAFSAAPLPAVEVEPGMQSGYAQYLDPPQIVEDAAMGSNGSFLADMGCCGMLADAMDTSLGVPVPANPATGGNGSFVSPVLARPPVVSRPWYFHPAVITGTVLAITFWMAGKKSVD